MAPGVVLLGRRVFEPSANASSPLPDTGSDPRLCRPEVIGTAAFLFSRFLNISASSFAFDSAFCCLATASCKVGFLCTICTTHAHLSQLQTGVPCRQGVTSMHAGWRSTPSRSILSKGLAASGSSVVSPRRRCHRQQGRCQLRSASTTDSRHGRRLGSHRNTFSAWPIHRLSSLNLSCADWERWPNSL